MSVIVLSVNQIWIWDLFSRSQLSSLQPCTPTNTGTAIQTTNQTNNACNGRIVTGGTIIIKILNEDISKTTTTKINRISKTIMPEEIGTPRKWTSKAKNCQMTTPGFIRICGLKTRLRKKVAADHHTEKSEIPIIIKRLLLRPTKLT